MRGGQGRGVFIDRSSVGEIADRGPRLGELQEELGSPQWVGGTQFEGVERLAEVAGSVLVCKLRHGRAASTFGVVDSLVRDACWCRVRVVIRNLRWRDRQPAALQAFECLCGVAVESDPAGEVRAEVARLGDERMRELA